MAERLTDKDYFAWHYRCGYQNKKDSLERTQKEHKLGKFEDIMEKYGIDSVEELDKQLANGVTWQEACELACEREDDCYVYDNIHRAYEFYQQAKTEGNDE